MTTATRMVWTAAGRPDPRRPVDFGGGACLYHRLVELLPDAGAWA